MLAPANTLAPREVLIQNSPLTYIDQIRTPLLIIHSDDLSRTGAPKQRLDRILRIREFFERYLDRQEAAAARQ